MLGSTSEAKCCCLLHPLFLWLCSTRNSHLSTQVCFDFSYSISLTSSLFPLIYGLLSLWFSISPFPTQSMCKARLAILFYHCPTSYLFMSMSSLLIFSITSHSLVGLALTFKHIHLTPLLSLAFMMHFSSR